MFVSNLVKRAVRQWPDRPALIDDGVRISYRQLGDRTFRMAQALIGLGLNPGDRVLDLQKNSHTYVESDLACAAASLVRVPVNTRLSPSEWAYIAENSGARGVIYGPEFAEAVGDLLSLHDMPVAIATEGGGPGHDLEALLRKASPAAPSTRATPEDIVSLNYSSGTTGQPKGCIRTAANRHASLLDMLVSLFEGQLGADDTFLHAGPITHASGLFVLPHIAVGGCQVLHRSFDEERVRKCLEEEHITGTVLVPTMLERVLATFDGKDRPEFPALRRVAYAGSPMAPERIGAAFEAFQGRLLQFYGLVEAIPPLTVLSPDDHLRPELRASAGRPVLGAAIEIVDDQGSPVEPGESGELVIGGQHVMNGYWGNKEATVKTVEGGWLSTGDIARVDEEGYIYLVDRRADMIITGGFNVMPREIELVLAELDEVAEAAVVGIPDPKWGEAVTAFVVLEAGHSADPDRLSKHCSTKLSGFKKPKRFEFVDDLPKASTGKVSRSALKQVGSNGAKSPG